MNERGLLNQIINNMRMNQQQGAFGNVTDNEMSMFLGNPKKWVRKVYSLII